mgnify:CR=1 FL=1
MKRCVSITCDFDLAIGKVNLNEIVYRLNEIKDSLMLGILKGKGSGVPCLRFSIFSIVECPAG